jgi:hypothetical protein
VRVTDAHVGAVTAVNLRIPRTDFAAVWAASERRWMGGSPQSSADWYAAGVAVTCQWLAGAVVPHSLYGGRGPAHSPVTEREAAAYEELVEVEFLAAERLAMRRPRPRWLLNRPGWIEGICATLRWAWRRSGPPPLPLPAAPAAG